MKLRVGTSGYSYPAWKGSFYPKKIRPTEMLPFYGERFSSVEINHAFRKLPEPSVFSGWAAQVGDGFVFAVKAPQMITHMRRLNAASATPLAEFIAAAQLLGPRLGPLLFQLPPNMKQNVPLLREFLARVPAGLRVAFEFRHPTWFDDATYTALSDHGVALCVAEDEELATPLVATTDWGYVRLRREDYRPRHMKAWAERIAAQTWSETFVFLKHEDAGRGPALAKQLLQAISPGATSPPAVRKGPRPAARRRA